MDRTVIIIADEDFKRLDKFVSDSVEDVSRSLAARLIDEGNVTINGKSVNKSSGVKAGDSVAVTIPPPEVLSAEPQNIPVEILYEDDHLLIVNKPKGMVVHPAVGNPDGTLVNALMYHCGGRLSTINGVVRPGIVHRIDKNTSGLLAVAKTDIAHAGLAAQIKEHSFTREYIAVICGHLREKSGTICAPIGRNPNDRMKMAVTERNSKPAVTHYQVIEELRGHSFVKLRLETGRTHQIRVHMSYIGHPVYGDDVYGHAVKGVEGQCLHAYKLGFMHPVFMEYMEWSTELPQYFSEILMKLR